MTRQQMADRAGVSVRTFNRWCKLHQDELYILGMRPHMRVLTPRIVAFLAENMCIDLDPD